MRANFAHFCFSLSCKPGSKNRKHDSLAKTHEGENEKEPIPTMHCHSYLMRLIKEIKETNHNIAPSMNTPTGKLMSHLKIAGL